MFEKLNNIMIHPSTLIEYRNTNIFVVLLFLFFLSVLSITTPVISTITSPGYTYIEKEEVSSIYGLTFAEASKLPSCAISDNEYLCDDKTPVELMKTENLVTVIVVSDPDNSYKITDNSYYLKLTKDSVKLADRHLTYLSIGYNELPSGWQKLNFKDIKNSENPDIEYFKYFLTGFNEINKKLVPYSVTVMIIITYLSKILEALFYALLLFVLYGKTNYKYKEVFKILVFAETIGVFLGVILDLLGLSQLSSILFILLTFIYVYIALFPKLPEDKEF